ncbi:hypothetical protein [Pararhizobium sp. PWRC1-1]|uniref:hypothetical protein n=1 Tax=Pararhizobium sp. PWRC1-1 TaxID=2804566 RepID=UPI003CFB149E
MHKITKRRFDATAGYARRPEAVLTGEELGYFETDDSRRLLVRDRTDRDFAGMAFGRDARLRFRWTSMTAFSRNPSQAVRELEGLMTDFLSKPNDFHHQGDEIGPPVDFSSRGM